MKHLLTFSALAALAAAKNDILLPIYSYPTTEVGKADWAGLVTAIDANPSLDFYVIINNGNGPNPESGRPNPPNNIADWAPQIDALNQRANAHTIGYINTLQSTRDVGIISQAVDEYAVWNTNGSYNIKMDGIFFDEISVIDARLGYNEQITTYAKSIFTDTVVLNPGVTVPAFSKGLFAIADSIVQLETCYTTVDAAYDGDVDDPKTRRCPKPYTPFEPVSLDKIEQDVANKTSVLIHDFYDSWYPNYQPASSETLQADVTAILNKTVHSFYIAQYGWTRNFTEAPASIENVARLAAQGPSS